MASKPGLLTAWPWQFMGNFKYLLLMPWVAHGLQQAVAARAKGEPICIVNLAILPFLLVRMLHNQIWISLSRFQNARSPHRIVDRSIEFEQVDRERNWDDQILFNGLLFYITLMVIPPELGWMPIWRTDGMIMMALLHTGPVEFLYYWFHRALHHHFLYTRYHSHHHGSIATEPITSVTHPFAEHIVYFALFAIPMVTTLFTGCGSIAGFWGYIMYIDFMNNMGHCNFELIPKWLFCILPPLKYLVYTPSFHSLHHTQFRTNYSLFMPLYDYIYNTMDETSDELYESSLEGKEETPDAVHLTHLSTLQSIYHMRLGFASIASRPYNPKWYMLMMWPIAWVSMALTWIYGSCFTIERNTMEKLIMQTWAIPRYSFHYELLREKETINTLIEKAILEADEKGVTTLSLGLHNQAEELNRSGEVYIKKYPKLRIKIVDGSSLVTAVVLKSIPAGTKKVLLLGNLSKIARAIVIALCKKRMQVMITHKYEFHMLKEQIPDNAKSYLALSNDYTPQVWLVGDGLVAQEQRRAQKGTKFIPFSQFPQNEVRKDCTYYSTPAMNIPQSIKNIHSCENWLPRRVMSAWRVAGIVHALEKWDEHECGESMLDIEKVWDAAIRHGFTPLG